MLSVLLVLGVSLVMLMAMYFDVDDRMLLLCSSASLVGWLVIRWGFVNRLLNWGWVFITCLGVNGMYGVLVGK